jgi:hypothetical protein
LHYDTADEALKIWSALAGLLGLVTGVVATYFFTRPQVARGQAFTQVVAELPQRQLDEIKAKHPTVGRALA